MAQITGIREARSIRRNRVGGKTHLIVQTSAGEVAFYVNDNATWIAAIQQAAPAGAGRQSPPTAPEP